MKTPKILVTAAAALAVAAPATHAAGQKTVTINTGGFAPAKATIASGDSITWVNKDTVNRQVVATGGQFASPVTSQNGSWTREFSVAGTFKYRDTFKSTQTGTIVVSGPPPSVSLAATAPIVTYGGPVTL